MMDSISRMVPGVLSNQESGETESFSGSLLEYPQYSRPEVWRGHSDAAGAHVRTSCKCGTLAEGSVVRTGR